MKRLVILFAFMLLLTGCSVNYNLVINEDLSVTEEARLTGTDSFFANYYKTTRTNVLQSNLDVYKSVLDESNYKYELVKDTKPYVLLTNTYKSVNEYINNSKLFNGYFDEIKYTENDNIKKIETIGFNDNNPDDPNRFDVKELVVSIKCPYKVTNHNATSFDKKTNTFYYEKTDDKEYKILLEYDVSKKYNPNSDLITTLLMCIGFVIITWIIIILTKNNKKV